MADKRANISNDMFSKRITIRVSESLVRSLKKQAGMSGQPQSVLVRDALEKYLGEKMPAPSAYFLARNAGLIGCVRGGPSDLSTNREHFQGFGV
jgi:predicted DNA-binding protein